MLKILINEVCGTDTIDFEDLEISPRSMKKERNY
jgi:hypothetical protein